MSQTHLSLSIPADFWNTFLSGRSPPLNIIQITPANGHLSRPVVSWMSTIRTLLRMFVPMKDHVGKPILDLLLENERLFEGKKILAVGDIALDRTFRCTPAPPGTHAIHGSEGIYDIFNGGDDFGAIGASYNTLAFCRSLDVRSTLVSVAGTDPEGDRVEQILRDAGQRFLLLRLPDTQTVARIRFFVLDRRANRFELLYRFDKDPDIPLSYVKAEHAIHEDGFLDRFETEAADSDVVLFNDTDKGFLSAGVVRALGDRIERAASMRTAEGLKRPLVIVDPKAEWDKYRGLNVDVLKPNNIEACKALSLSGSDLRNASSLEKLGHALFSRYGGAFHHIVVTLGSLGAAVLNSSDEEAEFILHPALPPVGSQSGLAMHCGDMFSTALALALVMRKDLSAAVDFANYAGSLQVSKDAGEKISRADLVATANVDHYRSHHPGPKLIAVLNRDRNSSPG